MDEPEIGDAVQWALSVGTIVGLMLLETLVGRFFKGYSRISYDVVEHMESSEVAKDTLRNVYTNLAIVGALIMTISYSLLFVEVDTEKFPNLAHLYVALCSHSCAQCVRVGLEAVINILYTEPLNGQDCLKYLIAWPGSIGGPVLGIVGALFSLMASATVHITMNWSLAAGCGSLIVNAWVMIHLFMLSLGKSSFTPKGQDENGNTPNGALRWKWVVDGSDCPILLYTDVQVATMRRKRPHLLDENTRKSSNSGPVNEETLEMAQVSNLQVPESSSKGSNRVVPSSSEDQEKS